MRKERLQKQLYQILSNYFAHHITPATVQKPLITIRDIYITPKSDIVKVFLSLMPLNQPFDKTNFLQKNIRPHTWEIRKAIAQKLRHTMRHIPKDIRFYLDDTAEKAIHFTQIINELN